MEHNSSYFTALPDEIYTLLKQPADPYWGNKSYTSHESAWEDLYHALTDFAMDHDALWVMVTFPAGDFKMACRQMIARIGSQYVGGIPHVDQIIGRA